MSDKLFREFAIDPSLLARNPNSLWNNSSIHLLGNFGWDEGNIICMSDFNKPLDSNKYPVIKRKPLDSQLTSWLDWVVLEHERKAFTRIICSQKTIEETKIKESIEKIDKINKRRDKTIIVWDSLQEDDCKCFKGNSIIVNRTPQDLASSIDLLLLHSFKITLIDPYFCYRDNNNHFKTLECMIQQILQNSNIYSLEDCNSQDKKDKTFIIHCKYPGEVLVKQLRLPELWKIKNEISTPKTTERNNACSILKPFFSSKISLSQGFKLRIIFWIKKPSFHNRYVLTRNGGVQFGWGIDSDTSPTTDDVALLSEDAWRSHKQDYKNFIKDNRCIFIEIP